MYVNVMITVSLSSNFYNFQSKPVLKSVYTSLTRSKWLCVSYFRRSLAVWHNTLPSIRTHFLFMPSTSKCNVFFFHLN